MRRLARLQFIVSLLDRASGPLARLHAHLNALGLEQMKLLRANFHTYGNQAAQAARKVALITTALTSAIAAGGALVSTLAPLASMAAVSVGAAIGTANAAGVARETNQLSQQTGMNTAQIQGYRFAGRSVGLGAEFGQLGDTSNIFAELGSKMQAPNDELAQTLQKVKIPLREIKNLKPDELLQKVVDQANKLGLSDVKKTAILEELAGDASKLLPLLGANNAVLQRFQQQAIKTGAIISPEQADLMQTVNTEWALMRTSIEGYGNILAEVGGNFMKLFGPEVNQWFMDNTDGMRQWADNSVKELERLHEVFKTGGLQAVYEDLFPNLSAFTARVSAFVTGFDRSFASPFMQTVRSTWTRVSAVLGNTAGGAEGFGTAFGAAILPVLNTIIEAIGDTVIFLENNWTFVKQLFAWSPLGLIMSNWGTIRAVLEPVGQAVKHLAEFFGLIAPGINDSGSALGSLFGLLAALAGVLMLNKLAFGAVYHLVKLYNGVMIVLRASTMLITAATWLWNAALVAVRAVSLVGFLLTMATSMGVASVASWSLGGALAFLASPITLIVAGIAALVAGAIYLYTHWAQVKAYLAETSWGSMLLAVLDMVISPLQTLNGLVNWLLGLWNSTKASLMETSWGPTIVAALQMLFSPVELFKMGISSMQSIWQSVTSALSNTSWAGAIMGAINSVMAAIERFKAGWASLKAAAGEGLGNLSNKISGAWGSVKASIGMGGGATDGGARAAGGPVLPGHFYRVNERGPEMLLTGGNSYLMTGGMQGNIIPFPLLGAPAANDNSLESANTPRRGGLLQTITNQRRDNKTINNNGRTIHIGTLIIQSNKELDAEALMHELEMAAG